MIGSRLTGQVRSFQGAWGFIISDNFAGDLFVHRDSFTVKDPQIGVGMMVAFNVERDQRRKGSKDRLVARQVEILSAPDPNGQAMYAQGMAGAYQQPLPVDPYMGGAMAPGAYGMPPQMYYPQMDAQGIPGYAQPNPYAYASPYAMQQPLMQPQPQVPVMPQVLPQQQYQLPAQTMARPALSQAQQPYLPAGVAPVSEVPQPGAAPVAPKVEGAPLAAAGGEAAAGQGLLHITMHDWEPDQPGQLWVTKGTLVNVSYRAAHGWVYASTHQPGNEGGEPTSEGWLPQAVVKRVSLCRVAMDWPAEGAGTLGVTKGEVVAVSKEAERGWVYGERIGPRQLDKLADGWLPKKVLDYLQS
jgi:cold shock CspA family protein